MFEKMLLNYRQKSGQQSSGSKILSGRLGIGLEEENGTTQQKDINENEEGTCTRKNSTRRQKKEMAKQKTLAVSCKEAGTGQGSKTKEVSENPSGANGQNQSSPTSPQSPGEGAANAATPGSPSNPGEAATATESAADEEKFPWRKPMQEKQGVKWKKDLLGAIESEELAGKVLEAKEKWRATLISQLPEDALTKVFHHNVTHTVHHTAKQFSLS